MPHPLLWLVVLSTAIAANAIFGGGSARRHRHRAPVWSTPLPEDAVDNARARASQGKKILGIKELRKETGLTLQDAKDVVDALAAGHEVATQPSSATSLAERARELRAQGRMIDAISAVVSATGMTEAEATRFIESLD